MPYKFNPRKMTLDKTHDRDSNAFHGKFYQGNIKYICIFYHISRYCGFCKYFLTRDNGRFALHYQYCDWWRSTQNAKTFHIDMRVGTALYILSETGNKTCVTAVPKTPWWCVAYRILIPHYFVYKSNTVRSMVQFDSHLAYIPVPPFTNMV